MVSRRSFIGLCGASLWTGHHGRSFGGEIPGCLVNSPAGQRLDVDIHCHVFNGSDLQVGRFLSKVAYRELPKLLQPVVIALGPLLERATWDFAPKAGEEIKRLRQFGLGADIRERASASLDEMAESDIRDGTRRYEEGLSKHLQTPEGQQFYQEYRNYFQAQARNRTLAQEIVDEFVTPELEQLANPEALRLRLEQEHARGVTPVFGFMRNFFNYRYVNAYNALKNYGCDHGHIQLIAPAMVDYDYGLGAHDHRLPSSLVEQMEVMERIAVLFQGRVLPYAPFDPWRVAAGDSAIIKAARAKIESGGLLGLKIYPPMGFAPYGNASLPKRPQPWPVDPAFAERLDAALADVWSWAQADNRDIPILAHSSPSNYPHKDFAKLGSPENWLKALKQFNSLRVCFGHSGGQALLDGPWADGFAELEEQFAGAYNDLSYFDDALNPRKQGALAARVRALIATRPATASRSMYGSDWIMLALEKHSERYYDDMTQLVSDPPSLPRPVIDGLMSNNAIEFMGLRNGRPTRARLTAFYQANGIAPQWLTTT